MKLIVIKNKNILCTVFNATIVPRIGETVDINGTRFAIKDVVWRLYDHSDNTIEIRVQ